MGLIEELATYLAAAGGGTLAVDIFAGFLPDEPDLASALLEYPGREPVHTMGAGTGNAYEIPRLQVVCRGASYLAARSRAQAAFDAFDLVVNQTLSGTYYLRVHCLQSPFLLDRENRGAVRRVVFAFNIEAFRA